MDLILWRHAEAQDADAAQDDLQRPLTPEGVRQAAHVAQWLDRHLREDTHILCSPALRAEQTVQALGLKYTRSLDLAPGRTVRQLLHAAGWPESPHPVLLVGHQPVLGQVIAHLLVGGHEPFAMQKAAVWWLRSREGAGRAQAEVVSVISPEQL